MGDIFGFGRSSSAPSYEGYLGGMDFANEYEEFKPYGEDYTYGGPDLSYEPEDLPGSEPNAPSESPRFSDYLKMFGSEALEGLGSGKKPKKQVFDGGSLRFPSSYSGPRGGVGGYRPIGGSYKPKQYMSADEYNRLMEDKLKIALAEMIRNSRINPLV